jgi:hypothetical protein
MMKYVRYIILLFLFIGMAFWLHKKDDERAKEGQKLLHNDIVFSGEVVEIKSSHNHSFGIIYLKLTNTNTSDFVKSTSTQVYPYSIYEGKAELYTSVPDGISQGDIVSVNSNEVTATYYYKNQHEHYKGSFNIIVDPYNIEFINKNRKL